MPESRPWSRASLTVALFATGAAIAFRYLLDPWLGEGLPFVTLFPAVVATVWYGGALPGTITAALGYLLCATQFVEPRGQILPHEVGQVVAGLAYLASMAMIIWFGEQSRRDRTQAQSLAEKLQSTVDDLQTLLEILPVSVVISDATGTRLSGNRVLCEMLGVAPMDRSSDSESYGSTPSLPFRCTLGGEDVPAELQPLAMVCRTGRPIVDLEHDLLLPTGETRNLLCNVAPLRRTDGSLRGAIAAYTDITAIRKQEQALRESQQQIRDVQERLQTGLNNSLFSFAILQARRDKAGAIHDFNLVYLNPAARNLLQLEQHDPTPASLSELFHRSPLYREFLEWCRATMESGRAFDEERESQRDGHSRWFRMSGVKLDDSVAVWCLETTRERQAERELRASEERFRLAVEAVNGLLYDYHFDSGEVIRSPHIYELLGYHIGDVPATAGWWFEQIHPDDQDGIKAVFDDSSRTGNRICLQYRVRHRNGHWVMVEDRAVPMLNDQRQVTRVIGCSIDISQRKMAEELLQHTTQQLQLITDSMGAGVAHCSRDLRYTWVGKTYASWMKLHPDQIAGQRIIDILGSETFERIHPYIERVLSGEDVRYDVPIKYSDNGPRWVSVSYNPTRNASGQVDGWVAVILDIDDRKRIEQGLRESEARFHSLADSVPVHVWVNDHRGHIEFANARFAEFTGSELPELAQRGWGGVIHPEDQANYFATYEKAAQEGVQHRAEIRLLGQNDDCRWFELFGHPRVIGDQFAGYAGISLDVTSRRLAQERLRLLWEAASVLLTTDQPDALLRGVFSKIGPSLGLDVYFNFVVEEPETTLRLASCAGVTSNIANMFDRLLFGQSLCGRTAQLREPLVIPYLQNSLDPDAKAICQIIGARSYVCHPLISNGTLLGTLSFASRSRDELSSEELDFLETICRYLTAAYERVRLIGQLRADDVRKDEFLAVLAHELRNPLAPIRNAVAILKTQATSDPQQLWIRDVIDRQVAQMARLLDDLLDISRITRNKLELRREPVLLQKVIENAVETSRPLIDAGRHTLELQLPEDEIVLDADPVRLAQIFSNLLNNSAKYTEQGGRLTVTAVAGEGQVCVTVTDTGIGISPEVLPHVFEMFAQDLPALKRSQGGLGIGLSLVRGLVEMHGGSIVAHSEGTGRGSAFTVTLPCTVRSVPESPTLSSTTADAATHCYRIIVADDNADAGESLAMMLRLLGHEVTVALDGQQAVQLAIQQPPQLALLDIGMPILNGYEAAERIRALSSCHDTVLAALTGWGQEDDRRRSREAGFHYHLVKPLSFESLQQILAQVGQETFRNQQASESNS